MRIEASDDVAAAVKIDDAGHRRCRLKRPVEPQADRPAGAGDEALLDLGDRKRLGLASTRGRLHLLARLGGCHLLDRPKPGLGHNSEDFLYLRVKLRHGSPGIIAI